MERPTDKDEESNGGWEAANMRLLQAGFRRKDQGTIDAAKERIKAGWGEPLGDRIADGLEMFVMEEMIDAEIESTRQSLQAPDSKPKEF